MLVFASQLVRFPVLSLQVGGEIALCDFPVVDPNELKLIAYTLTNIIQDEDTGGDILVLDDVREFSQNGFIIDSGSRFVSRDEVVRLDEIMSLNFDLIGLKVVSESGKKIGKIKDFTIDTKTFMVYQIIVDRPAIKSFVDPELTINRSQIVEIDDYKITIKNEAEKISLEQPAEDFRPNFVNPFRSEPQLQDQNGSIRHGD